MNKTNLLLDLGIFAALLVTDAPRLTGITLHEWISVAFAGVLVIHILLHWKWIMAIGGKFLRKLFHASRLQFVVDVLLFVAFTAVMLSGLLISRAILPVFGLRLGEDPVWRMLHSLSADASVVLVGIHFALNWDWVVMMGKRYLVAPFSSIIRRRRTAQGDVLQVTGE